MKHSKKFVSILTAAALFFTLSAFATAAFLPGDVSGDGQVTAEDARLCLRQAVGLENYAPGSDAYNACDVTGDGAVTAEDARLILRAAVGLETLQKPGYTENNEYDIYRSGTFYMTGSMTDSSGTNPLEIGRNDNVIYMSSEMEGQQIAMQVIGSDVYMIHPGKNAYYKLTAAELSLLGIDLDDLTQGIDMSGLPSLSQASGVTEGLMDGTQACTVYTFDSADGGRTLIYMDGDRFLGMDTYTANWVRTDSLRITSISKTLPEKVTTPGGGAKRVWLFTTFIGYFM